MSAFNAALFNSFLFGGAAGTAAFRQVGQGLLYPALRKAGVTLGPGRTPSPAQFQDSIDELNRLVGSLNCDRLNIYSITEYQFPLTGKKSYTMGEDPSGLTTPDFDGPWPIAIDRANVIYSTPPIRRPLAIVTDLQWARIRVQDLPNTIPSVLYNDRAYPLANIYLYGQPLPGYILELFVWQLVPSFVAITDAVMLPPGYEDALVLNLAVRLGPHFQRAVDPDVRNDAQKALMRIESINAPRPTLEVGFGCNRGYMNVYSGEIS